MNTIPLSKATDQMLSELSKKRKAERNINRTKQDIVADLIKQAHDDEITEGVNHEQR